MPRSFEPCSRVAVRFAAAHGVHSPRSREKRLAFELGRFSTRYTAFARTATQPIAVAVNTAIAPEAQRAALG
jgi:hypothetical protein